MLAAILETTLGDDVFAEDTTTTSFESHVASIAGREAGLFVVTGTMANQLSLHALVSSRPCGILVDADAHCLNFEGGGPSVLSGGMMQPVKPRNGKYLTVEDLERNAILDEPDDENHDVPLHVDVHKCPTGIISMENTAGGIVVPLHELKRIRAWATRHGVKTHLDGARLFEAVAAGAGTLREYCGLVDLVSVDFSKNLGAPMGAMVLGDSILIRRMRRTRKAIGGGLRQAGVITAAAREALFENFGRGDQIESPVLKNCHAVAKRLGEEWVKRGGRLTKEVETNIVWLDIEDLKERVGIVVDRRTLGELGRKFGVLLDGPRVVCHHQIDERAVADLVRLFCHLLDGNSGHVNETNGNGTPVL